VIMDKSHTLQSTDDNIESPTTYGKDAYKKYRKKEKLKEEAGTLGGSYGQKRTRIVMDERYSTLMAQYFKDVQLPANKPKIIQFLLQNRSRSISGSEATDILSLIQQVPEREYNSVADLIDAVGLLKDTS
jgi:hypothetical protein